MSRPVFSAPCPTQCNLVMMALYTRGLRAVSSLQATVTAVAANMWVQGAGFAWLAGWLPALPGSLCSPMHSMKNDCCWCQSSLIGCSVLQLLQRPAGAGALRRAPQHAVVGRRGLHLGR